MSSYQAEKMSQYNITDYLKQAAQERKVAEAKQVLRLSRKATSKSAS